MCDGTGSGPSAEGIFGGWEAMARAEAAENDPGLTGGYNEPAAVSTGMISPGASKSIAKVAVNLAIPFPGNLLAHALIDEADPKGNVSGYSADLGTRPRTAPAARKAPAAQPQPISRPDPELAHKIVAGLLSGRSKLSKTGPAGVAGPPPVRKNKLLGG